MNEDRHWDDGYVCLPNNFALDVSSSSTFEILFRIVTFHYCDEKELGQKYIQLISGKSRNTVKKAVAELLELGYLELVKEYSADEQKPSTYRIRTKFIIGKKVIDRSPSANPGSKIHPPPSVKNSPSPRSKIHPKEVIYINKDISIKGSLIDTTDKKKEDYAEIKNLITIWNNLGLKKFNPNGYLLKRVNQILDNNSIPPETLIKAFKNYSKVLLDRNILFDHKWSFMEFLTADKALRFFDENSKFQTVPKRTTKNGTVSRDNDMDMKTAISIIHKVKKYGSREASSYLTCHEKMVVAKYPGGIISIGMSDNSKEKWVLKDLAKQSSIINGELNK